MPVPKRRTSKSKKNMRRAHDFLKMKSLSTCPQCQEAKEPHRVCPKCGFYKGREVIATKDVL
jgi:large subunit ribosomal protein L32